MFGWVRRAPPLDPDQTRRNKQWVSSLMGLSDQDTILLAEPAFRDGGCPDLETVIAVIRADRRRFMLRFPQAMSQLTEADMQYLSQRGAGRAWPSKRRQACCARH